VRRFDYSKLASYIEIIPRLGGPEVLRYLNLFRKHIQSRHPYIDPARSARRDLDLAGSDIVHLLDRGNLLVEIAEVIETPRALKSALRRALSTWDVLHGEVDLNELLLVCILRESTRRFELRDVSRPRDEEPHVANPGPDRQQVISESFAEIRHDDVGIFDVVTRQVRWLRDRSQSDTRSEPFSAERELLERLIRERRSEGRIVAELFPEHSDSHVELYPQCVVSAHPTDYLARILAEGKGNETPDQVILREMERFKRLNFAEESGDLVKWFVAPGYEAAKVFQFTGFLGSDGVCRLAEAAVQKTVREYPEVPMDDQQHCIALTHTAQLLLWNSHDREWRLNLGRDAIKSAMRKSLLLAHDLEHRLVFRPRQHIASPTDSAETRSSIAAFVQDCFVDTFASAPAEELIDAVDYEYVLSFLIRRLWDKLDGNAPPDDAEGWSRAASALVRAAEVTPAGVGTALAIALTATGRQRREAIREGVEEEDVREWSGSFDEEFATVMLREEFVPAMRVFARLSTEGLSGELLASVHIAKDYATRFLAERDSADN
jgi:hypothetical protein